MIFIKHGVGKTHTFKKRGKKKGDFKKKILTRLLNYKKKNNKNSNSELKNKREDMLLNLFNNSAPLHSTWGSRV